jgi:hypothetical protein
MSVILTTSMITLVTMPKIVDGGGGRSVSMLLKAEMLKSRPISPVKNNP